ncbi:MAG: hypothetical protein AAB091_06405 [Elusimicrobiota bacterium]
MPFKFKREEIRRRNHRRPWHPRNAAVMLALLSAGLGQAFAEQAHHQAGAATVRAGQWIAQPWETGEERLRWRIFGSYLSSQSRFDALGDRVALENNGRYSNFGLNAFLEYALNPRWSIAGLAPLQWSRLSDDLSRERWVNVGDTYGWVRRSIEGNARWSAGALAGIKIPGNYRPGAATGDRQTDMEAQGFLGHGLGRGSFASLGSGYRVRFGSPSDEIFFNAQFGWNPGNGWLLVPAAAGALGVGGGVPKDFLNAGVTIFRSLRGPWRLLGSYNRVIAGKNTVSAGVWALGVSYQ